MSKSLALLAAVAFAGLALGQDAREASNVAVYNTRDAVSISPEKELTLKFWVQELLLSALYRNVVQGSSLDEWQRRASAPTRIYCRYTSAVALAIPERATLTFDEVLLPLPSDEFPDFIFIKRGDRVQRLAKYDPWVLHKLVSEANLPLYTSLSHVERALF